MKARWKVDIAHVRDGCHSEHNVDVFVELRIYCHRHEKQSTSKRVADVGKLLLLSGIQYIQKAGWDVKTTHFIPAIDA